MIATVLAVALVPKAALAAPAVDACISASDQGQVSRDEGRLRDARAEFTRCSDERCPVVVRTQCHSWLTELDALQPTVVPSVRDETGADVVDARVQIDGESAPRRVDGLPVPLDPGRHSLRFEAGGRGATVVVVLRAGEKNRIVAAALDPSPRPEKREAGDAAQTARGTPSWIPYALAGVGVLGLTSAAYFGVTGNSDLTALERAPCAGTRTCSSSEVSSIRTRFVVADVSLAVAVIASLGAVVLWPRAHDGGSSR